MGSVQIVVGPPCVDKLPGPTQGREQMLVEALGPELAIDGVDGPRQRRRDAR